MELCNFLNKIKYKYNVNQNPFHNFKHGISVMHGSYNIVTNTRAKEYFDDLEKFSLVFSGLCHDVKVFFLFYNILAHFENKCI